MAPSTRSMTTNMMGPDLPVEIWHIIGSYFPEHADDKTLWNLSNTSHYFRALFLPLAYKDVTLHAGSHTKIFRFARTCVQNTHIANLVRGLEINCKGRKYGRKANEVEWARSIVQNSGFSSGHTNKWMRELEHGSIDGFLALLLICLKKLQRLGWYDMSCDSPFTDSLVREIASEASLFNHQSHLRRLRKVTVGYCVSSNQMKFSRVANFFRLPGLKQVVIHGPLDTTYTAITSDTWVLHRTSTVEDIHIAHCEDGLFIEWCLEACANLKRLSYEHEKAISREKLHRLLMKHNHSLNFLNIYYHVSLLRGHPHTYGSSSCCFGSLSEFTSLERLWVHPSFMMHLGDMGAIWMEPLEAKLPVNLKSLFLTYCPRKLYESIIEALEGLRPRMKQLFPALKTIAIGLEPSNWHFDRYAMPLETYDRLVALQNSFALLGIALFLGSRNHVRGSPAMMQLVSTGDGSNDSGDSENSLNQYAFPRFWDPEFEKLTGV